MGFIPVSPEGLRRMVTLRRCQRDHWALHRSICRREPLHVWWRWVSGRSVPRMAAPLVITVVCLIAVLLAVGLCRLVEPSRSSWAVSYRA